MNYMFFSESNPGSAFACVYEVRTDAAAMACYSDYPEYDLELNIKIFPDPLAIRSLKGQVLFSFISPDDYLTLIADAKHSKWILKSVSCGIAKLICEIEDLNLRPGIFYAVLIQIRSGTLSIDIGDTPIVTGMKIYDRTSLSGLVGLMSVGSKFAIKSWKIKGVSHPNTTALNKLIPPSQSQSLSQSQRSPLPVKNTTGIKSLSQILSDNMNLSTSSYNAMTPRLGDPLIATGGGGPGRPTGKASDINITPQTASSSSAEVDANKERSGEYILQDISSSTLENKISHCSLQLSKNHDRSILETILRDIIQQDLGVKFEDIAALNEAKRLLNEAIVLPLIMPEFFTGIREPWRGVLLFGPPGTGKTLLAKAVAGINSSTFFSCSASSLISKFRGESEKLVRCLFEAARICAPSIVFLDEVDALVSSRGAEGEHEASRRLKTEFFSQMDGITSSSNSNSSSPGKIMVLCTTNCPWDLDEAMRRRLEKRIYIPLPDIIARVDLFSICLRDIPSEDLNIGTLASLTEGYSGADIHLVCREASMMPMRKLLIDNTPHEIQQQRIKGLIEVPKVLFEDFVLALKNTRPSVSVESISRFENWDKEFGSK